MCTYKILPIAWMVFKKQTEREILIQRESYLKHQIFSFSPCFGLLTCLYYNNDFDTDFKSI